MLPDGCLASEVPHIELNAPFAEAFDIETLCGHNILDLFFRHRSQNSGLACVVKPKHAQSHILRDFLGVHVFVKNLLSAQLKQSLYH
jgi:hypothetical protein